MKSLSEMMDYEEFVWDDGLWRVCLRWWIMKSLSEMMDYEEFVWNDGLWRVCRTTSYQQPHMNSLFSSATTAFLLQARIMEFSKNTGHSADLLQIVFITKERDNL